MNSNVLALDLGGTRIKIGIVDGGILAGTSVIDAASEAGLIARLPAIESEIDSLLSRSGLHTSDIVGVGVSIPGIVDSVEARLLSVNRKYSDAVGFDFKRWAREKWHAPIVMENDARSALISEWQYGAGRGCNDLVMVTLGTGIGGAAIIGGRFSEANTSRQGSFPVILR